MEPEKASQSRRGWRAAAVRCAVVLAGCALLASLTALALLLLLRRQEPPAACAELVEAESALIKNRTLKWAANQATECKVFGHEFYYDNDSGMLKIKSESVYHIYVELVTECILEECETGNVTLIIHHKTAHYADPILSLSLHLYPRSNRTVSASTAISFPLKGNDSLHVTLTAITNSMEFQGWQHRGIIFKVSKSSGRQVTENNDLLKTRE